MNQKLSRLALLSILTLSVATMAAAAPPTLDPAGHWTGAIELPNGELEIAVELIPETGSAWSGTIDIPLQGLRDYELSGVEVDDKSVRFAMDGIPGEPSFDGTFAPSADSIAGTFRQGPQALRFSLRRASADPAPAPVDAPVVPAVPVPGEGAIGNWFGVLTFGPAKLRLALDVEAADGGALDAVLDSIDQGAEVPADLVAFEGGRLRISFAKIGAFFDGTINEDGSNVQGTWSQGGRETPLTLHRLAAPAAD